MMGKSVTEECQEVCTGEFKRAASSLALSNTRHSVTLLANLLLPCTVDALRRTNNPEFV